MPLALKVRFAIKHLLIKNETKRNLNFPTQNAMFPSKFYGLSVKPGDKTRPEVSGVIDKKVLFDTKALLTITDIITDD